jgi:hypothetical protein
MLGARGIKTSPNTGALLAATTYANITTITTATTTAYENKSDETTSSDAPSAPADDTSDNGPAAAWTPSSFLAMTASSTAAPTRTATLTPATTTSMTHNSAYAFGFGTAAQLATASVLSTNSAPSIAGPTLGADNAATVSKLSLMDILPVVLVIFAFTLLIATLFRTSINAVKERHAAASAETTARWTKVQQQAATTADASTSAKATQVHANPWGDTTWPVYIMLHLWRACWAAHFWAEVLVRAAGYVMLPAYWTILTLHSIARALLSITAAVVLRSPRFVCILLFCHLFSRTEAKPDFPLPGPNMSNSCYISAALVILASMPLFPALLAGVVDLASRPGTAIEQAAASALRAVAVATRALVEQRGKSDVLEAKTYADVCSKSTLGTLWRGEHKYSSGEPQDSQLFIHRILQLAHEVECKSRKALELPLSAEQDPSKLGSTIAAH